MKPHWTSELLNKIVDEQIRHRTPLERLQFRVWLGSLSTEDFARIAAEIFEMYDREKKE